MRPARERVAAIPTTYAGVHFRSRLEARWAVLFDKLGWSWDYEPLDARGTIPDYVVRIPFDREFLVEIKPSADFAIIAQRRDQLHRTMRPWLLEHLVSTLHSVDAKDGVKLSVTDDLLRDIECVERGEDSRFGRRVVVTGPAPFLDTARDACTIDGRHYFAYKFDGTPTLETDPEKPRMMGSEVILKYWREAGNAVQWKPEGDR